MSVLRLHIIQRALFLGVIVGCSEMLMANAVQSLAAQTPGKEAIAIESFAKALRQVSSSLWLTIYLLLPCVVAYSNSRQCWL